ncbi:MAG: hypothetical protein ABIP20_15705 [Chthoniobacteraceae bacterium]
MTEVPFERLSDRGLTGLGQKALKIRAGEWKHAETEHFIYHFFDSPMASVVSVEAEFSYRVIATELGKDTSTWERKCHLFLFDDAGDWKAFQQFGGLDPWTGGIHSEGALFVRRNPGWKSENATLPHEITHLVIYRFFGPGIPLWLNEGFAEYAAARCRASFYRARGYNARPRANSVKEGQYLPVSELTSAMTYPTEDARVAAFYEESQKLVRFLSAADRNGFLTFLEAMGKGALFETAARNHFGNRFLNLEAVEREFKSYATSPLIPTTP